MIFPRFSQMHFPGLKGQTFAQRFGRGVMLGCVLALAAWAFWTNVGHRLQGIKEDAVLRDELSMVREEDRQQFIRLSAAFEQNFGVALSLKILRAFPEAPADSSLGSALAGAAANASMRHILVEIAPRQAAARISLPPLVLTAVGEPLRQELEAYLVDAMTRGESLEALVRTLRIIWDKMLGD